MEAAGTAEGVISDYTRMRAYNEVLSRDKIGLWRFGVPRLKEAFRMFTDTEPVDELHARGPNKTGKTLTAAAFVIACLQKRKELDGVPIPQWKGRVKALQLVLDFPQQLLSVKPAYEQLLDGWPCRIRTRGDYLHSIHVMPVGGSKEDERDWSVVYFLSQKNRDTGRGARADVVHFDEPPQMFFLRELRKAGGAGRRSIRVIGETPEHLREWAPIREDYGDTPRRTIRRVSRSKAEVRWSLDEVLSWVLSDDEKARMREEYANDPLKDAREHGDYTNAEGSSPWGEQGILTLLEMLQHCTEPEEMTMRVPLEAQDGTAVKTREVPLKVWKNPEKDKTYYEPIDPSSGVDDGKHHEAALTVSERGTGDLCCTWAGYIAPWSLGVLGAGVGRQYHTPPVDVETNDHWGVNVIRGLEASRYGNIAFAQRLLRPGEWAKEAGFKMDEARKAVIIGRIQEWLATWGAYFQAQKDGRPMPRPYGLCQSREVIEQLLNAELDDRGKVVAGPGLEHGHFMVLWGQSLDRAVTRSNRELPDPTQIKPAHPDQELIRMIKGEVKTHNRGTLPRPKQRPRI